VNIVNLNLYVVCFHLGTVMKWRKSQVYDVLHKSTVTLIIGFCAVTCGYIGYRSLRWFVGMHFSDVCSVCSV